MEPDVVGDVHPADAGDAARLVRHVLEGDLGVDGRPRGDLDREPGLRRRVPPAPVPPADDRGVGGDRPVLGPVEVPARGPRGGAVDGDALGDRVAVRVPVVVQHVLVGRHVEDAAVGAARLGARAAHAAEPDQRGDEDDEQARPQVPETRHAGAPFAV